MDPNHFDTEVDRVSLTYGVRLTMQALLEITAGKEYV
jgi:hypothetical protein